MAIFTTFFQSSFRTRARTRVVAGICLSVLIHVLLFLVLRPGLQQTQVQASSSHEPLEVTLVERRSTPAIIRQPEPIKRARPVSKPTPQVKQLAHSQPAPAMAVRPFAAPSPSPTAITPAPPDMDMSTMLAAARERRQAAEDSAVRENAAARAAEQGPSANDIARENIAFQEHRGSGGTNGVFEIVSKGPRVAMYIFRGWTTDARHSRSQTITVDAGRNGDVEKAIVDSMIALIRQYYSGDFNWQSQRLGRIVSLSARQADTAGLQAFLLREFFS